MTNFITQNPNFRKAMERQFGKIVVKKSHKIPTPIVKEFHLDRSTECLTGRIEHPEPDNSKIYIKSTLEEPQVERVEIKINGQSIPLGEHWSKNAEEVFDVRYGSCIAIQETPVSWLIVSEENDTPLKRKPLFRVFRVDGREMNDETWTEIMWSLCHGIDRLIDEDGEELKALNSIS